MKKTLVALAVLAASGASFAQVTMTGEFTWGYKATTNSRAVKAVPQDLPNNILGSAAVAGGADSSGFGVDYSNINFMASEDLGGGTKVSVKMGIDGADRSGDGVGGPTTGQDANITLTGGFGKLMLATMENVNYLGNGIAAAGDPAWIDLDNKVQAAKTNGDRIQYSYAFGPVTLGLQHLEAAAGLGEGVGSTGNTAQRRNLIEVTYAAGALTANAGYAAYDNQIDSATSTTSTNRVRASANYDFGVAKVGFGVENTKRTNGSVTDTFLGANAPIGALTLAVSWGSNKVDNGGVATVTDGTKSGYGVGAAYALSKRTQLIANYRSWEDTINAATRSTDTRVYIDHSF
jgi:predicted porin